MARRARFILCFLLLICATTILRAYEFEAGGIVYNILSDTEAEVALGDYSGDITISSTVTDNGKTYSVISIGDDAFYLPTAIRQVESNREGRGVVYDLNGHRVEHPTKGLYVVNGKKVMMK